MVFQPLLYDDWLPIITTSKLRFALIITQQIGSSYRVKHLDRYIIRRLISITSLVLVVLIFIFIIIDFSENSDDFTDRGATMGEIWGDYYINYIPEMIRLVLPLAIFSACLYLVGQLSERLEITSLTFSRVCGACKQRVSSKRRQSGTD